MPARRNVNICHTIKASTEQGTDQGTDLRGSNLDQVDFALVLIIILLAVTSRVMDWLH